MGVFGAMTVGCEPSVATTGDDSVSDEVLRAVAKVFRDKCIEHQVWSFHILKSHLEEQRCHVEDQGQDLARLGWIIHGTIDPGLKDALQQFYERKKQHLTNQRRDIMRMMENICYMEWTLSQTNARVDDVVDQIFNPQ